MATYQNNVKAARERVFQAEEALDVYIRSHQYNSERFQRLADEVSNARGEFLDLLTALWPAHGVPSESGTREDQTAKTRIVSRAHDGDVPYDPGRKWQQWPEE